MLPKGTSPTDEYIINKVRSFNIESKTPMDCMMFLVDLKKKSMAKYDELPVFKATYDLLLRIYMVSQHWSRDIRYTLGEELKKEVIEILQLIYQANASKKKVAFLSSCRVKLIKVRLQIRVAKDLKQLHLNQYGLLAEMQENISKQLSGWEKSERRKEKRVRRKTTTVTINNSHNKTVNEGHGESSKHQPESRMATSQCHRERVM